MTIDHPTAEDVQIAAVQQFDTLLAEVEASTDQERDHVFGLLEAIDAIHRPAITALVERLRASDPAALYDAAADPVIALKLDLYGLSMQTAIDQVMTALEPVAPYIHSHGGGIELLDVDAGVVTLRLTGTCMSCPASTATLRNVVEQSLRRGYPVFQRLEVAPAEQPVTKTMPNGSVLLPMASSAATRARSTSPIRWVDAGPADLLPGSLRAWSVDGKAVIFAMVGGDVQAFEDACPDSGLPLDSARISAGSILVSPWSNTAYDLQSGRSVDGSEGTLRRVPAHIDRNRIWIGVLQAA